VLVFCQKERKAAGIIRNISAGSVSISSEKARKIIIRARVYRLFAILFAGAGVIIFVILYLQQMEGDIVNALKDRAFLTILLLPFLPAFILSLIAKRLESKYFKLVAREKQ
jgi:hypothetical protein